tara:strand:+ start:224 stop:409 length:186 start_codon:yes stop_codon:yes gene_type:complete
MENLIFIFMRIVYMPYKITKLKNGKYQVKNTAKNKIVSKGTTLNLAKRQVKLLNYIEYSKS